MAPPDADMYARIVTACLPHIGLRTYAPITHGWDSFVLLACTEEHEELIFRFPKRPDVERSLAKELSLLPELAPALPAPIPHVTVHWSGGPLYPHPFIGYRKLEGTQLASAHPVGSHAERLADDVGRFLEALHAFPVTAAARLGVPGGTPANWRGEYLAFYAEVCERVLPLVAPQARIWTRRFFDAYLDDTRNFAFAPALIHRDLGADHVLWDPLSGRLTGVIDWGDASIGDPALDFVGLYLACGRPFTERALAQTTRALGPNLWSRIGFYAELIPYYEINFGVLEGNAEHIERGLSALTTAMRLAEGG